MLHTGEADRNGAKKKSDDQVDQVVSQGGQCSRWWQNLKRWVGYMVQAAAPLLLALFKERTVEDHARIMDEFQFKRIFQLPGCSWVLQWSRWGTIKV